MTVKEQLVAQDVDVTVSRRDLGDHAEIVADFGPGTQADVDVVGETVIVVAGEEQYELEIEGDAEAFMQNGVVTIEVNE